jgi:endonuclease/exonuclease/phosphatase (EEP) superfamily protein YafD
VPQTKTLFVAIYKPPGTNVKNLCKLLSDVSKKYLQSSDCIVFGDFNIDWSSEADKKSLEDCMVKSLGFRQEITSPTTDYQSTLDLVFSRCKYPIQTGTREVYYSDHKMIWAAW